MAAEQNIRNLFAVGLALDGGPGHGGDALSKESGGDDGELHGELVGWCLVVLIVMFVMLMRMMK